MTGQPLPPGKVPAQLLERLFRDLPRPDDLPVGPGIGLDAAVLDPDGRGVVAASDPITFAAEEIGWYAVHVNANDVACMGGRPRWFLATVLLPEGARGELAEEIQRQIVDALEALDAVLAGGHTEVAPGLGRPLVVGTMLGPAGRTLSAADARPGDVLLLAGSAAVEATALVAREREEELAEELSAEVVARARDFLHDPGISVVPAALAAVEAGARALHDPTEGGILHGVRELCAAAGVGAVVEAPAVEVRPETRAVCRPFDIDPLGALASGALLVAAPPEVEEEVLREVASAGVVGRRIGRLVAREEGMVLADGEGGSEPFPDFDGDEIGKIF